MKKCKHCNCKLPEHHVFGQDEPIYDECENPKCPGLKIKKEKEEK